MLIKRTFGYWQKLFSVFFCCIMMNSIAIYHAIAAENRIKEKLSETMDIKIIPHQKSGLFDAKHPVKYGVSIANYYKNTQEGKISLQVKTARGKAVTSSEVDFKIRGGASKVIDYVIPVEQPGFYEMIFSINVTDYDDTIRNVFGYKPYEINSQSYRPADFDQFWQNTIKQLHEIDPKYSITYDETQSTSAHSVYNVEMRSWGGVTVQGWLTVPNLPGKYPVLVALPGCKVHLKPIVADEFVLFLINIRQTKAPGEEVLNKEFDYSVYNIDDRDKYIYRGAYMDCERAIDFLCAYKDMGLNIDASRIGVSGGSQGGALALVISALDHRVKACISDNPIYCDVHNLIGIAESKTPTTWPVIRYEQYLRFSPYLNMKTITKTMDYYDPQNFTPMIQCPVLLASGALDVLAPPSTIFAAFNKLNDAAKQKSEIYNFYHLAHEVETKHRFLQTRWLLEKLLYPPK